MNVFKPIICAVFVFFTSTIAFCQPKGALAYILDDTYLTVGITNGGIMYSPNFRDLGQASGLTFAVEQYFPTSRKMFFNVGLRYLQNNFKHSPQNAAISIRNHWLELPLTMALELPILRKFDTRLLFGTSISRRLASSFNGDYPVEYQGFKYSVSAFNDFYFGWHAGISFEYQRFFFRFKQASYFVKLDKNDQGMLFNTSLECGFFIFRRAKL